MPRNIDECYHRSATIVAQGDGLQIDGDSALPFFGVAVGGNPGERGNKRRLAMVHVSSEADDHTSPPRSQNSSAGIGVSPR